MPQFAAVRPFELSRRRRRVAPKRPTLILSPEMSDVRPIDAQRPVKRVRPPAVFRAERPSAERPRVERPTAWYDEDQGITAHSLIDDPREPVITPIGVLDSRGKMLCRVTVPIKQKIGFQIGPERPYDEHVETLVPEDLLRVSDCGQGLAEVDASMFDEDEDYEDTFDE